MSSYLKSAAARTKASSIGLMQISRCAHAPTLAFASSNASTSLRLSLYLESQARNKKWDMGQYAQTRNAVIGLDYTIMTAKRGPLYAQNADVTSTSEKAIKDTESKK